MLKFLLTAVESDELKACAEVSATLDKRMQKIFDELMELE